MILTEQEFEKIIQIARLKITPGKKLKLLRDLRLLLENIEIVDDSEVGSTEKVPAIACDNQKIEAD